MWILVGALAVAGAVVLVWLKGRGRGKAVEE